MVNYMENNLNFDIYEHHFGALYYHIKSLIGESPIYDETIDEEDLIFLPSKHLFDIGNVEFNRFKAQESEYRSWIEIYIFKIIKNILERKSIFFEEYYYGDGTEAYSMLLCPNGIRVEVFFLYDISYESASNTDYDKISKSLHAKADNVDEIHIFILRDAIHFVDLANLVNGNSELNQNGLVKVFPIKSFFLQYFDEAEYNSFISFAREFHERIMSEITYKTVIIPSKNTLSAFRTKKSEMLQTMDYKAIFDYGKSGFLTNEDFLKVEGKFLENKMYLAMTGKNDFSESFISAEWLFDIYSHSMGELELTGIISGYIKSIEQLMYKIVQLNIDKGFSIRSNRQNGNRRIQYTKDNAEMIDSTLGSLNEFITSKEAKLALSAKVRGCMNHAISQWTRYQRNGYFHKHNLYKQDNKIDEIRSLTLFLYFIILGGLEFSSIQLKELGIHDKEVIVKEKFNIDSVYINFKNWFNKALKFDLPIEIPGLVFMVSSHNGEWQLNAYLLKVFDRKKYISQKYQLLNGEHLELSHLYNVQSLNLCAADIAELQVVDLVEKLLDIYKAEHKILMNKISGIVLYCRKIEKLVH